MITLALTAMGLIFLAFAAVLTAADAAFNFFPRHDAETVAAHSRGVSLQKILAAPVTHMNALRFWRAFFEMAVAVCVAVLFLNLVNNIWLAGLVATAVMTVIAFVLV
ncbi:MAG: ion transporter, partial [Actinomycetota bacterium]|nr:ion transporter [Actinomycetota bacterium]